MNDVDTNRATAALARLNAYGQYLAVGPMERWQLGEARKRVTAALAGDDLPAESIEQAIAFLERMVPDPSFDRHQYLYKAQPKSGGGPGEPPDMAKKPQPPKKK